MTKIIALLNYYKYFNRKYLAMLNFRMTINKKLMENTVQERLESYLDVNKIKKIDFCSNLKVSKGYIANIRKSIQPDKLVSIAKYYPELNIIWLLTGNGNMVNSSSTDGLPLYRAEAAAGFGTPNFSIEEKDIEARYRVREFVDASFMLYVHGKSMLL